MFRNSTATRRLLHVDFYLFYCLTLSRGKFGHSFRLMRRKVVEFIAYGKEVKWILRKLMSFPRGLMAARGYLNCFTGCWSWVEECW